MYWNLKSNFPNGTKIFANWMGWFNGSDGKKHAANVCQSDDARTVRNQVLAAHSVGIDGFVVDWYGATPDYAQPTDKATQLLAASCNALGMEFSIMLDAGTFKWASDKNKSLAAAMSYVRQKYFTQPNYTKITGKPVLWEFGWGNARMDVSAFARNNPDISVLSQTSTMPNCVGSFGWVNGFGSADAPRKYMEFYLGKNDALQIPCIFDGFDDHDPVKTAQSRWGGPARTIHYGQWQMCIDEIKKAVAAGKNFPAIQICTWNDYDERTQVESEVLGLEGMRLY